MPEDLFRPQLGEPHHYAYVVEDIEATVNRLVRQLGAGPFFVIESVTLENLLSRGEPAEFVHNSAFGYCGGGAIELIEVISLAPERVQEGFSGPRPAIHHVAYAVPRTKVTELRSSLDQRGLPQYLSAQVGEVDIPSTTPPPRWGTTSKSMSTVRVCVIFSSWSAPAPTTGTARNRCARSLADRWAHEVAAA